MTRQSASPHDDEADLRELLQILWARKWLIVGITCLFAMGGLGFAVLRPGSPDTYTAKLLFEIGSYQLDTGAIVPMESSVDLAEITSQRAGVKARIPPGSQRLISFEATHVRPDLASGQLARAVDFAIKRHQKISQQIGERRLIEASHQIGEPDLRRNSLSEKKLLIATITALFGLISTIFVILMGGVGIQQPGRRMEPA